LTFTTDGLACFADGVVPFESFTRSFIEFPYGTAHFIITFARSRTLVRHLFFARGPVHVIQTIIGLVVIVVIDRRFILVVWNERLGDELVHKGGVSFLSGAKGELHVHAAIFVFCP
jgi:hypothetical protein